MYEVYGFGHASVRLYEVYAWWAGIKVTNMLVCM